MIYVQVEKLNPDEKYERFRYLIGQELTLAELGDLMKEAE